MELIARIFPPDEFSRTRLAELLVPLPEATSARYPVSLDDPVLPRILAAGRYWVAGQSIFSRRELASTTHFEAVCRYTIPESDKDYEANSAMVERTPQIKAGGFEPIRLTRGFILSRIRMKPNMIGSIGGWTEEYVAAAALAQALRDAGCSGYTLQPVIDSRTGGEYSGYHQLYSEHILPAALIDCSVECIRSCFPEENGRLRKLGCLSYRPEDLAHTPDFSRTADPWAGLAFGWPSWVVSARVVSLFRTSRLRGWAFRPVLVEGTDLCREYLAQWGRLCTIVDEAVDSTFDGGQW